jgi:hypothetical protein
VTSKNKTQRAKQGMNARRESNKCDIAASAINRHRIEWALF